METTSLSEQQHRMLQDRATVSGEVRDPARSDTDSGNEHNVSRKATPSKYHFAIDRQNIDPVNKRPDRLCGLVVRVSGYRYRGLGFDSRRYQIF